MISRRSQTDWCAPFVEKHDDLRTKRTSNGFAQVSNYSSYPESLFMTVKYCLVWLFKSFRSGTLAVNNKAHLHICTSAHLHICTSAHLHSSKKIITPSAFHWGEEYTLLFSSEGSVRARLARKKDVARAISKLQCRII